MRRIGAHAVVVGGSMAGLLAAAALHEAFEQVTVLDRDRLPDGVENRRAVPQGRHAHTLLPRGAASIEALLPGMGAELLAAGAPGYRAMGQVRMILGGHELARADIDDSLSASRPFVEAHVRRRVRALPNVRVRDRVDVLGLLGDGERVDGVRAIQVAPGGAEELLHADLVVAATGRSARVRGWLEALGHARPAEGADDARRRIRHALPAPARGRDRRRPDRRRRCDARASAGPRAARPGGRPVGPHDGRLRRRPAAR